MRSLLLAATLSIACLSVGSPALAQGEASEGATTEAAPAAESGELPTEATVEEHLLSFFGIALGVAFTICGAAYGIARIAAASVEGMARQPEVSGDIRMALIITAAMIEGIAFFALIICLLELFK